MSTTNWKAITTLWKRSKPTPRWRERRIEALAEAKGPSIHPVLDIPYLLHCFDECRQKGQAPGPDGLRYWDFGRQELTRAFWALRADVLAGRYCAPPVRIVEIPKTGGTRQLALDNILHRVLASAALGVIEPELSLVMSPITHSACGRGVHTLLRALHWAVETGRYDVLVNHDVRSAFPSLSVNVAMHAFRMYIRDRALLGLIDILLRGAEGPKHHVGIPQGLALSPLALDFSMSLFFDRYWPSNSDSLVALRYVDNVVFACTTMDEGRRAVDRCRTLLGRIGLSLKDVPEQKHLCNLRNGGVSELLGFNLSLSGSTLRFDVGNGALQKLQDNLTRAKREPNPPLTSRDIVVGWIGAMGPAFDNTRSAQLTEQVLETAHRNGFREIPGELVRSTWEEAGRKWQRFLQRRPSTRVARSTCTTE